MLPPDVSRVPPMIFATSPVDGAPPGMNANAPPRLLLINPNTTPAVTDLITANVRRIVGDAVEIVASTGRFGCRYISSEACYAVATHAALDCFAEHAERCDSVLLACFGDPGLFALRELSRVPVTGLAEACLLASAARVRRFSIVTGGVGWPPMLQRLAGNLDLGAALASVRTIELTGGQIAADPDAAIDLLAAACEAAAVEDGAEEVILGGAGLAGLVQRIQPHCRVPVHCSVIVGATTALQRMSMSEQAGEAGKASKPSRHVGIETAGLSAPLSHLLS
jgi:Asp/Glu/hydantoin racemase